MAYTLAILAAAIFGAMALKSSRHRAQPIRLPVQDERANRRPSQHR